MQPGLLLWRANEICIGACGSFKYGRSPSSCYMLLLDDVCVWEGEKADIAGERGRGERGVSLFRVRV
jgi:hypothetical protein